ncbi:MAG TPA: nuclear transport factor 2 family protein [Chitinophagaceae bacterium]|nr:nuclear transport factor 2 family protein [Chitinophagaceae bacterium]
MKLILLISALMTGSISFAQPNAALQSLVNAEKAFAQTSKDKSTNDAFSAFMSDSGFIFQAGPVLGKKFWMEAEQGTDLLTWEPVFADVSSSGDLGYTTGPWEFRAKRNDANPVAGGYYVSVWKKERNDWKVALDIGISYPLALSQNEAFHFSSPATRSKLNDSKISKKELLEKEQQFINEQTNSGWSAYNKFITAGTRIYRPGSFPFITTEQKNKLFSETDKKFSYHAIDAIVASSGDLGYVYGKAMIEITKDGNTKSLNGNYLRIWKKEKDTNWKIALDLVNIAR